MEQVLPHDIIYRSKLGFPTPLAGLFREAGGACLNDVLLGPRALGRGYFRRDVVQRLVTEHQQHVADHDEILWRLLVLEEWHRCFIDQAGAPATPAVTSRATQHTNV
jgi:asparagine synthase (glutamine-hydrolysing)